MTYRLTGYVDDEKARIAEPYLNGLTEDQIYTDVVDIAERTELDHLAPELTTFCENVKERRRDLAQEFGRKSVDIVAPRIFEREINGDDTAMLELLARHVSAGRLESALNELEEIETRRRWVSLVGPEKARIAWPFWKDAADEKERDVILSACHGTPAKRLARTVEKRLSAWREHVDAARSNSAAKEPDGPSQTED